MSQQFNSPFVLRQLVEYVQKRIGRPLQQDELSYARNFLQEHVPRRMYLSNIELAQAIRQLGDTFSRNVATATGQEEVTDVHEMLVDVMRRDTSAAGRPPGPEYFEPGEPATKTNISDILGIPDAYSLGVWLSPYSSYGVRHLLLDSSQRFNKGEQDVFRWNVTPTATEDEETATFAGPLRDIVAARISPFWTPGPSDVARPPAQYSIYEFYIGIDEFAEQTYQDLSNVNFQFIMLAPPQSYKSTDLIFLNPVEENRGLFVFDKPVTNLNSVTLRITSNGLPVPIASEFLLGSIEVTGGFVIINVPNITSLLPTKESPYPLIVGESVVVQNYTAPPEMSADLYSAITDPNGVLITNVVSPGTYELNISGMGTFDSQNVSFLVPRRVLHIALTLLYRRPENPNELE